MTTALLALTLLSEPTLARDDSFSIVPPDDWAVLDRRAGGVEAFIARVRKKNRRFGERLASVYRDPKFLFFAVDGEASLRGSGTPATLMVMRHGRGLPRLSRSMLDQFSAGILPTIPRA